MLSAPRFFGLGFTLLFVLQRAPGAKQLLPNPGVCSAGTSSLLLSQSTLHLHLGQSGSRTPTCLWLVWHLGHSAPHGVPFLDGGAPLKVQQQGGGDGDVAPGPTAARQLQARAAGCSLESSPWAPVLLARGTQLMFSNTKWSCLQMPSKSQNSPNLPSFVNRLQPTPMTIAACLCASLQLHGGAALRG